MAPAPTPYVLRLPLRGPRGDQKSHVLVGITPSSEGAPARPLDLELVATDNIKAYVMTLQHGRVSKYRHDDSACSDPEWQDCLEALLLDGRPVGDVEAYAQTSNEGYLFIHVQKRLSGHPESLGALKLRRSNAAAENLDIFDWCAESAGARARLEGEIARLRRRHDDLQKLVAEETARFGELERSKHEFETEHDSWLRDLLNEKKLKIRMQERVLATADVDQDKLDAVAAASRRRRPAAASRKGKRKAESPGLDVESDDGADRMDVDVNPEADESHDGETSDVGMTTQDSDTASESESEPRPEPKKAGRKGGRESPASTARGSRKKAAEKLSRNLRDRKATASASGSEDDVDAPANRKRPPPAFDPDESTASE